MTDPEVIRAHWDAQAALGERSGTRDLILKRLEQRFLDPFLAAAHRVLDAGCGDGATLRAEALRRGPDGIRQRPLYGFDYSEAMIESGAAAPGGKLVEWRTHNLLDPVPAGWGRFDLVFTERAIINLVTWDAQRQAIAHLVDTVAPGGRLVLVENSIDALERLNRLRCDVGLTAIAPPWHNRYLSEPEVLTAFPRAVLLRFTDAYYFLSRVVNARLAAAEGREPDYDALVNRLALSLPLETACGGVGQTVAWVWAC